MTFPTERRSPNTADGTSVVTIDLSPDGTSLVSGSTGGEVAVWDTASLTKSRVLANGPAAIKKVKFSPDGGLVVATNDRNELSFVRIGPSKARGFLGGLFGGAATPNRSAEGSLDVAFSANGKRVAAVAKNSVVNVLEVDTLRRIKSLRGDKVVALSPRGDLLASANFVQTRTGPYFVVFVVSVDTGTGSALTMKQSWVNSLAFSPDGRFLACALMEGLDLDDRAHHVAVWSLPGYDRVPYEIRHERGEWMDYITALAFTPSGAQMLSACMDGTIAVWHVGRFDRVQSLEWQGAELTCLAAADNCVAAVAKGLGFGVWG